MSRSSTKEITTLEAVEIVEERLDSIILLLADIRHNACMVRVEEKHMTVKNLLQDLREIEPTR